MDYKEVFMSTTFKLGEVIQFENSLEYQEVYLSHFLRILGSAISKDNINMSNIKTIGEMVSHSDNFNILYLYLVRFNVYLLERGVFNVTSISSDDVAKIQDIELPESFVDYVSQTVFPLSISALVNKAVEVSHKEITPQVNRRLKDKRKGLTICFIGLMLESLKIEIDDTVTLDEIIENAPEFKNIIINSFKKAILLEASSGKKTEITSEMINNVAYNEFEYQELVFDIGQLQKIQILKLADDFGAPLRTSFTYHKKD